MIIVEPIVAIVLIVNVFMVLALVGLYNFCIHQRTAVRNLQKLVMDTRQQMFDTQKDYEMHMNAALVRISRLEKRSNMQEDIIRAADRERMRRDASAQQVAN
jgi:predicted Holliday junction resolvase-like endonuclease